MEKIFFGFPKISNKNFKIVENWKQLKHIVNINIISNINYGERKMIGLKELLKEFMGTVTPHLLINRKCGEILF